MRQCAITIRYSFFKRGNLGISLTISRFVSSINTINAFSRRTIFSSLSLFKLIDSGIGCGKLGIDIFRRWRPVCCDVATLEKTVSDSDSALSQRISSLDASYKSDNATTNARIAAEETARANADSATAQRVGALETGSANANSRIASLETATSDNKQAIATTQQQLTAKFDALAVGGRNLLVQSRLQAGWLSTALGQPEGKAPDHHDPTYYPCVAGEKFIGRVTDFNGVTSLGAYGSICFYDNNKVKLANYRIIANTVGTILTAIAPPNTAYYRIATAAKGMKDKIEKGNIATDWTPAPEDIDAKFATTDATINAVSYTHLTLPTILLV